jgi:hypothetical protein
MSVTKKSIVVRNVSIPRLIKDRLDLIGSFEAGFRLKGTPGA